VRARARAPAQSLAAGIRLAAKKGGKSAASRSAGRPAPPPPPSSPDLPPLAPPAAQMLLSDDAVVWSAPDEIELSTGKEVGVLNLPDYDQWKVAQAAKAAEEVSESAERGSMRRRRRREGGKDDQADEPVGVAPVLAPLAPPADASATDFAERANQRRERRVEAETAAQQSAATAPLDLRAAAQAERERRRELLLMDPSADVYSRPTPLKGGGGMVGDNPFGFSAGQPASEDYDLISSVLGEGSRTAVGNFYLGPYLQSGSVRTPPAHCPPGPLPDLGHAHRAPSLMPVTAHARVGTS
jgi:hypothetical protein